MDGSTAELLARIEAWIGAVPWRRDTVGWLCASNVMAYLVGGTVRDAVLGVEGRDLDLAIDDNALAVGRGLADHLKSAFVPLDAERNVARVVVRTSDGFGTDHIDLAGLRGEDIMADLWARDLTVNAMAVQIAPKRGRLLDPTGGLADLGAHLLRATSDRAFEDDPLRMLRTARMRGKLGFEVERATLHAMSTNASKLAGVSPERVRDELLLMLSQPNAAEAVGFAQRQRLWDHCLPFEITEQSLAHLLQFESWQRDSQNAGLETLPQPLLRHREHLAAHWRQAMAGGRHRLTLIKLASMGAGCANASLVMRRLGRYLCLSTAEVRCLAGAVATIPRSGSALTPLEIYHHYQALGDAGLDAAVLAMVIAPCSDGVVAHASQLLDAWFMDRQRLVDPPRLVTGQDVMAHAGLEPGPQIGQALERLREAQVLGQVHDRQEALAWLGTISRADQKD